MTMAITPSAGPFLEKNAKKSKTGLALSENRVYIREPFAMEELKTLLERTAADRKTLKKVQKLT